MLAVQYLVGGSEPAPGELYAPVDPGAAGDGGRQGAFQRCWGALGNESQGIPQPVWGTGGGGLRFFQWAIEMPHPDPSAVPPAAPGLQPMAVTAAPLPPADAAVTAAPLLRDAARCCCHVWRLPGLRCRALTSSQRGGRPPALHRGRGRCSEGQSLQSPRWGKQQLLRLFPAHERGGRRLWPRKINRVNAASTPPPSNPGSNTRSPSPGAWTELRPSRDPASIFICVLALQKPAFL